jgi:hypothetical protein
MGSLMCAKSVRQLGELVERRRKSVLPPIHSSFALVPLTGTSQFRRAEFPRLDELARPRLPQSLSIQSMRPKAKVLWDRPRSTDPESIP